MMEVTDSFLSLVAASSSSFSKTKRDQIWTSFLVGLQGL